VTYSDKIGPVTIQPDLQYVKDPGADGGVGHALVALRDGFGGDAEFLVQALVRGRGAEARHADELAVLADEALPAHA
jgi:hypothetical protein